MSDDPLKARIAKLEREVSELTAVNEARAADRTTSQGLLGAGARVGDEQLRLFVEHVPAAVAMFDRDMRYLATSRRWTADRGLGDADLTGCSHYAIFPDLPERWREVHRRAGQETSAGDGEPRCGICRVRR